MGTKAIQMTFKWLLEIDFAPEFLTVLVTGRIGGSVKIVGVDVWVDKVVVNLEILVIKNGPQIVTGN